MMVKKDAGQARTAKRRHWREADARAMLAAWRQSGKGLAEFARERGVHARRLARWAARLEAAPGNGAVVQFHPVRLVSASRAGAQHSETLEVVLGNGRAVRVPYGFAPEHLRRLLQVLEAEA
jgi:transposase